MPLRASYSAFFHFSFRTGVGCMKPFRVVGQGQEGVPSPVMTKEREEVGCNQGGPGTSPISLLSACQDITSSPDSILPNGCFFFFKMTDSN